LVSTIYFFLNIQTDTLIQAFSPPIKKGRMITKLVRHLSNLKVYIGPVRFAEKISRNVRLICCERKTLFRMKKQAEKDGLQEKRTEPLYMLALSSKFLQTWTVEKFNMCTHRTQPNQRRPQWRQANIYVTYSCCRLQFKTVRDGDFHVRYIHFTYLIERTVANYIARRLLEQYSCYVQW